ncbi:MAG: hypothetical protein NC218_01885 [Acetobacter sp.]|nr:hypothetical protein [Acetobacter sp.]
MKRNWNVYRDYFKFDFTRIYWSRLADIHIAEDGLYRCDCCNKYPHECDNKKSAKEYDKIRQVVDKEDDGFGVGSYLVPITETGYLRADQYADAQLIWKIQRELAKAAGFELQRSSFW